MFMKGNAPWFIQLNSWSPVQDSWKVKGKSNRFLSAILVFIVCWRGLNNISGEWESSFGSRPYIGFARLVRCVLFCTAKLRGALVLFDQIQQKFRDSWDKIFWFRPLSMHWLDLYIISLSFSDFSIYYFHIHLHHLILHGTWMSREGREILCWRGIP